MMYGNVCRVRHGVGDFQWPLEPCQHSSGGYFRTSSTNNKTFTDTDLYLYSTKYTQRIVYTRDTKHMLSFIELVPIIFFTSI